MSKQKQTFKVAINNSVGDDNTTLELLFLDYIYNDYDWWTGEETNMVRDVVEQIKNRNPKTVKLIIDSQGGDAGIGLAIYNFLVNYNVKVETDVIGMAGSIASVIAQAANRGKRKMARNAFMVIHRAWGVAVGNGDEMRTAADVVDKYTMQIVDIYSQNTGKSTDEIYALIEKGDYWMTGTEAVAMGFADETYNDNEQFQIAARVKDLVPDYHNIPQNLLNASITEEDALDTDSKTFLQSLKSEFMSFKDRINAFIDGLKGKQIDTPDPKNLTLDVANVMSEPMQALADGLQEDVTNEIKPVKEKVEKLETDFGGLEEKITNAISSKFEDRIKTLETANETLKQENDNLRQDIQDKIGQESKDPGKDNPEAKVIGRYSSTKKD